jgi:hypothetical protein
LDRGAHFAETFKPDETVAVVSRGESGMRLLLVLEDASAQVAGHTDVERPASAGDNVCEVEALVHWWNGNETAEEWEVLAVTGVCEKQILRSAQDVLSDTRSSLLRVARKPRVILSGAAWGPASFGGVSGAKDLLFKNH